MPSAHSSTSATAPTSAPTSATPPAPAWLAPQRLLRISVLVALLTIVLKTLAWSVTGSVSVLSDALESFVNLAGALFALSMVTLAQQPADSGHPYGHHKAEYFSAGFEGVLIVGASIAIFWAAVLRLLHPQPLEQLGWGMLLTLLSSACNALLAWALLRGALLHRSEAMRGDARHLLTDVWTSLGVIVGLLAAWGSGWWWLDPLVAMGVALHICLEGLRLSQRAVQGLMDSALEPEDLARIHAALAQYREQQGATVHFDSLNSRRAGARSYVQLHMHVPAHWTLGRAAQARAAVEAALLHSLPGLHATIELLPQGSHTVFEQTQAPTPTQTTTSPSTP